MPSNFVCVICGKPVSKRQSYAYQNGRACKIHQETQQANQQKIEEKKQHDLKIHQEKQQAEERRKKKLESYLRPVRSIQNMCWKCKNEGITLQQYFMQMLVGLEREHLKGEFNLFTNPKRTAQLAGIDEHTRILMFHPLTSSCKLDFETYQFTKLTNNEVQLCQFCATECGYDLEKRHKELTEKSEHLTMEQLLKISAVYESSSIHEEIKQVAGTMELLEPNGVEN